MKHEVLIIDDEDLILTLVKKLVIKSRIHLSPLVFTRVNDALEYLQEGKNNNLPSLIFLDIHLQYLNAWDFLSVLENFLPSAPIHVVLITSSINLSDKKKSEEFKHVIDYLEKPLLLKDLEAIKKLEAITDLF